MVLYKHQLTVSLAGDDASVSVVYFCSGAPKSNFSSTEKCVQIGSTNSHYLVHRYIKNSRLLKFCHVPATSAAFAKDVFVVVNNSTNQTNKEGSMCY
jgi:hypothetical protein